MFGVVHYFPQCAVFYCVASVSVTFVVVLVHPCLFYAPTSGSMNITSRALCYVLFNVLAAPNWLLASVGGPFKCHEWLRGRQSMAQ